MLLEIEQEARRTLRIIESDMTDIEKLEELGRLPALVDQIRTPKAFFQVAPPTDWLITALLDPEKGAWLTRKRTSVWLKSDTAVEISIDGVATIAIDLMTQAVRLGGNFYLRTKNDWRLLKKRLNALTKKERPNAR